MIVFPVAIIIASYTHVILALIRMGSEERCHKAFVTCSSYLRVVGMYCGAALYIYMHPTSDHSPSRKKWVCLVHHPHSHAEIPSFTASATRKWPEHS